MWISRRSTTENTGGGGSELPRITADWFLNLEKNKVGTSDWNPNVICTSKSKIRLSTDWFDKTAGKNRWSMSVYMSFS